MAASAAKIYLDAAAQEAMSNEILSRLRSDLESHPVNGIELGVMSSVPTMAQLERCSPEAAAECIFKRRRDTPQRNMILYLVSVASRMSKILVSPAFLTPRRPNDDDAKKLAAVVKASLTKKKETPAAVADFINANDPTSPHDVIDVDVNTEWLKAFFRKALAIKTVTVEPEATAGEPVNAAPAVNLNEISRIVYLMRKLISLLDDGENPEQHILLGFLLTTSCTSITAVEDFFSKVVFARVEGTSVFNFASSFLRGSFSVTFALY